MEHSFIAWAKQRSSKLPSVKLGIGDDCALLATAGEDMVVTTDSLCDGTHFILKECGPRRAGKKLIGVNLSDLASMAATPVAVFLSLCLPRSSAGDIAAELFEGVFEVAKQYDVSIAGGDTNVWDGPLVIHMTAIGKTDPGSAWTRSGANVGDAVFVSGLLGGSILGKHLDFEPRVELAKELLQTGLVTAATDISDGLGIDLLNLTVASRCGAEVKLDQIPLSEAARELAKTSGKNAVDHALGDGEDFELLMTVRGESADQFPSQALGIPLTRIGTIVGRTGLWTKEKSGVKQLPPKGYVHR
ncbi:MAG: thiamine-phosphate kinase [Pirellula sp.]|jgi:thiamine-monophosphate kinase